MVFLVNLLHRIFQLLTLLVIVQVVLSYFMDPFHPIRRALDRFVEPLLAPIRRFLPSLGGLDFSPLILIVLIQLVDSIIGNLIFSLF